MNKQLLIVGAIFTIVGGVTAKTIQVIKERKQEENDEVEVEEGS